ncbi:MAG TPA: hypothetical protein EYF96_03975 [Nitrospinaceae bacterium]|nr:hypothetical protein [Nitrospinaceae bacterium]
MSFRGGGMSIRGGGIRKRKRRRKKRGGALIGADPRTWAPASTNRYAGQGGRSSGFRSVMIGRKRGSGWRSAVSAYARNKRGSGMGFSGAGMAFHGAGLRTGRLFLRRGTGRRMI